jgi:hypothetical protein
VVFIVTPLFFADGGGRREPDDKRSGEKVCQCCLPSVCGKTDAARAAAGRHSVHIAIKKSGGPTCLHTNPYIRTHCFGTLQRHLVALDKKVDKLQRIEGWMTETSETTAWVGCGRACTLVPLHRCTKRVIELGTPSRKKPTKQTKPQQRRSST